MKKIISSLLVVTILLGSISAMAQDESNNEDRKLTRAEKKAIKKQKEEEQWAAFQVLAEKAEFIVELVQVRDNRSGQIYSLSPRTNFVAVKGDKVIVQVETNAYLASNGLGGVTINGTLSDYRYQAPKKKNGTIQISFNLTSDNTFRGNNVQINVGMDGYARVTIGNSPTIDGNFMSIEESKVMVGGSFLN